MCETMANFPVEETTPYILTEDMIDAAMTEQFAYQDDIESEEDLSSQDDNMEVGHDNHSISIDDGTVNTSQSHMSSESVIVSSSSASYNNNAMSVLVIETGLDKGHSDPTKNYNSASTAETLTNGSSEQATDNCSDKTLVLNTSLNSISHASLSTTDQGQYNSVNENIQNTEEMASKDSENQLPILKKMLSDKPASDIEKNNIESIDLCDSETDELSEDESTGVELIDNELKSVMESNLMAEVGITLNKQKNFDNKCDTSTDIVSPKIAVKNVAEISTNTLNSTTKNNTVESGSQETFSIAVDEMSKINNDIKNDVSFRDKEQVTSTIQISKIAVPHQTFLNKQGQKMKCVYVRNSTTLPVVISSNQPSICSKNVKYMLASQVKKGPVQLSPIAALTNMAKQNLQSQISTHSLHKPHPKMVTVAQKLQRPPALQNILPKPQHFNQDNNYDSLIKSLLFHNLKKPYVPPEGSPVTETYTCMDCSDRFVINSSLVQHLSRRSINIRYWCHICKVELQFFNRCVLFKHLRGHNNSIKHIDTTCITFSPITKEMVNVGIASTFMKESINNLNLPNDECILVKTSKDGSQNQDLTKRFSNSIPNEKTALNFNIFNSPSSKITTVAGQSKSICLQTQTSVLLNKPICSPVPTSHSQKSALPFILPKTQKLSLVPTLQKKTNDPSPVIHNKPAPKSLILLCNKLPKTGNVKQNKQVISIPPNLMCESGPKKTEEDMIVDDFTIENNNGKNEEEEIDVENVTVDSNTCTADIHIVSGKEHEIKPTRKEKEKKSASPKSLKRVCSECGTACLNISKHLNGANRPINSDLTCKVCKLILPTKCALKIHLRIHMKMGPFKCPDCGKDFGSWEDVHSHLKFSCGHLAKCVRFMCISCKAHFPSVTVLGHHISSKHARDIFKCTSCPVAFFNKQSLIKHMSTSHPNETVFGMDYKQCSMCPKKLVPVDKFPSHVQEHTNNNNILIYGYKCPICAIVFANKMAFVIHQIKERDEADQKSGKKTKKRKPLFSETQANNKGNEGLDVYIPDGDQVSDTNSDIEEEPAIIRKYPEILDDTSMAEKDPLSLDDWEYTQQQRVKEKKEEICIVCKKNSVFLLPGIDLNEQSLCCKQCVKPLGDSAATKNNVGIAHSESTKMYMNPNRNNSNRSLKCKKNSTNTVQRSSSCDEVKMIQNKRRASDISQNSGSPGSELSFDMFSDIPPRKKSRKKQNKEKLNSTDQSHIQGQIITSKSPDELICSKCEFVADTRDVFLDHITIHRTDPNTFQCLECGLCFVVLPSLERHLQMVHGIKDVNSYIDKNKTSLPQNIVMVEEDTDNNQCSVCYEVFDSSSSLEKHFRTHGMAFMNSLIKSP